MSPCRQVRGACRCTSTVTFRDEWLPNVAFAAVNDEGGHVVDFLHISHWPVFNVADVALKANSADVNAALATKVNAGPTTILSTVWQLRQALECSSAGTSIAAFGPLPSVAAFGTADADITLASVTLALP